MKVVGLLSVALLCALTPTVPAQTPPTTDLERPAKTWRQKEHGKLFHYKTGKNLPQLAASAPGTGEIVVEAAKYPGLWGLPPGPYSAYPHPYLVDTASRATAVILGSIEECTSALTEDEEFIFTDCQMKVEEVLKDNPLAPIPANSAITVTRPGGTIVLNGRPVRAREFKFEDFKMNQHYVLFLSYVATTGSYRASNAGSFELAGNKVRNVTGGSLWVDVQKFPDATSFLSEVRDAIAKAAKPGP